MYTSVAIKMFMSMSMSLLLFLLIQMTPPLWATRHYVWTNMFQFSGAQVATKALKFVCSTEHLLYISPTFYVDLLISFQDIFSEGVLLY